jgi:membrane protein required for beta-lactamase induction
MLLYALRTNQYNKDIEELKIKLEFKKDNIDKNLLFNICPNLKQTRVKTNLNSLVIKNLFFNSIRNTFSILFLFILLGAPAAIAYKVLDCMIYSDEFKITAKVKQELKKYLYYLDYVPIRLTSYTFSVVSNYDQVINKINNLKLSNNQYLSNIEFINQTGESVYDETAKESDQIVQIQNILSRTLIAWLGIIVLLAVTGIFI